MKRKNKHKLYIGGMRHRAFSTLHAEYLSATPFPVCQARTGKGGEAKHL